MSKDGIQKFGTAENLAKASGAASSAASAISKFASAKKDDGSIDVEQIASGVMDVVDTVANFLPDPIAIFAGKSVHSFFII